MMSTTDSEMTVPTSRIVSCGDISCEFLVDPIPRPDLDPITVTYKPRKREVVLLDNQKPNAPEILKRAQELLRAKGIPVQEEIRKPKSGGASAFSEEELDEYAREDGFVVYGVND
jgi:nucleotide-binding universal stress UspA family protein